MFELSFIRKYLTPRRKQLSVSLIALLSVSVITLVVWLVVLFLSVTEGIEKNWLGKLTALNAPVRLQPTEEYFHSYYYNVDRYSAASHYMSKTIGQKARSMLTDPYDPEFDEEIPYSIAQPDFNELGSLRDPVKGAIEVLNGMKKELPGLAYQDIEMSGALLRLNLLREESGSLYPTVMESQLTNVSYLSTFPSENPSIQELLLPPSTEDLNHLLFLAMRSEETARIDPILKSSSIHSLKSKGDLWRFPIELLPEKQPLAVEAYKHKGEISHLMLPISVRKESLDTVERRGNRLFFKREGQQEIPLDEATPLFSYGNLDFQVKEQVKPLLFAVTSSLQGLPIEGVVPMEGLEVKEASLVTEFADAPSLEPVWPFFANHAPRLPVWEGAKGIMIARHFKENGVKLGDRGTLSYTSASPTGAKEMEIPIYIAGFYDPGIMAVGNKCILVPDSITRTINASQSAFTLDPSEANSLFVWFPNLHDADSVKKAIVAKLEKLGLDRYWKVQTFREYEFAKDLLLQFQSDKYLFSLVGVLILLVACTNIISLLVLLVADKKKEIGILRAMGAKRRSIATIFALCGGSLGLFSCLLGLALAFFTLKNIDGVVHLLSLMQGHEAFNAQFFGQSLPSEISPRALLFAAVATPVLSIVAGLIPAIKAARLNPCETLRSE